MPALLQQPIELGIELNSYKCDNVFAATVAQASWPVVAAKRLFEPPTGCRTYEMTCRAQLAADAFAQQGQTNQSGAEEQKGGRFRSCARTEVEACH